MSEPGLLRIIRYGTAAEQEYLIGEYKDIYDQIVINANMVAHTRASISKFLAQKCNGKPFFIDPQTHAFQHDLSMIESSSSDEDEGDFKIKKSYLKLIEAYGDPIETAVTKERRPLTPSDFKGAGKVKGFAKRVVEFQEEYLSSVKQSTETAKYFKFLKKKNVDVKLETKPNLIVAPYFYLSAISMEWLDINISLIEASNELVEEDRLAVQIVINNKVLMNQSLRSQVLEKYKNVSCGSYLVWIDGFIEQEASEEELTQYISFMNELGRNKNVISLYGSFFSICCGRTGVIPKLKGVVHGMEYGESRDVVPVGGGIPVAKFYFPALHSRLHFRDAVRAIRKLDGFDSADFFFKRVCACPECRDTISSDDVEAHFSSYGETKTLRYSRGLTFLVREFPTSDTKAKCLRHYLHSKTEEYRHSKYSNLTKVISELNKSYENLDGALSLETISHSKIWKSVLAQYAKKE